MLRPQDIVVLAWLIARQDSSETWPLVHSPALQVGAKPWRYADIARELFISSSESHASVGRLEGAGLLVRDALRRDYLQPQLAAAEEFLVYGVPYAFYAEHGANTRGVPTGVAAPPLNQYFSLTEEVSVWPDPEGKIRGYALQPLYKTVPKAVRNNPDLYELLALVDALRDGRSRERAKAQELLHQKLRRQVA